MSRMPEQGYTILEVMIFLAISGVLFASAVVAVGGSQAQARYSQIVRDFETQIKDVINDVSNGYYPDYDRSTCSRTVSGTVSFNTSISSTPATNAGCINIGKIVMFNLADETTFGVGTIVGVNSSITNPVDLTLPGLSPTLAYQTSGANAFDLTTYKPLRFGAEVTKISLVSDTTQAFSSLSFIADFANTAANSNDRSNGTLTTNVYGYREPLTNNTTLDHYRSDVENLKTTTPIPYTVNPPDGFYVCLLTPENRRARVIIGVDGVVTGTKTEFDLDAGAICP